MLWCALALLVSQPPQPCLGYAQRKNPSYATPHAAPLKRGEDALASPPLAAVLYTAATRCCAMLCYGMLCYAMLCEAVLCYATLCYDVLLGERIAARLVL